MYNQLKRGDTLSLALPKIGTVCSYKYTNYHTQQQAPSLKAMKDIMPLSDCKAMLETLKQYDKLYNTVQVNGKIFTKEDLTSFIKIHETINLKRNVEAEIRWFDPTECNITQKCEQLDQKKLNSFKEILLHGQDNVCVDKVAPNVPTSDLALLTYNRWLNLSMMHVYTDLLNKENKNTKVIFFSAIQESSVDMLTNLVSHWKTEHVDSCCIIMNIRLSETGNTFVANSRITGNHWVCIYYQFVSNV